ncbi:hypothetical protein [Butyricimonas paravirosa]|uniref:hypothetical protein n=1 Tax=Butyricimonas paravirosa TaxID=1472417 RepID=UPI00210BEAB2|nr:hypothetical protein [Butyricimonas paravirosa]MCQ4875166.1 hypothetical protein [Butyricimonas paravirosa]
MFRKIIDYLNLRQVGGLELFFALSMVLSAYSFMGIPMQVILWGGLFAMLFFKRRSVSFSAFRPLLVLAIFVLIHDFLYLFIANGNLNAFIMQILYFGCMLMAVNVFNIEKLKGSLNLVAIISMIGLFYQWRIIAAGGDVRPIQIPFLEMSQNRLATFSIRPSSFFMEPAAYVAFMYIPLAFSLIERKFVWTAAIILSEFLTTSTTGLLTSFIMLIVYVFTQKVNFKIRLLTVLMGVGVVFALTYFEVFQTGVNKLENTDVETNMRLVQGPYVVSTMKSEEMIFGVPYHNAYEYCLDGRAPNVVFYKEEVYMSTTWILILKYGFVGLFLYLLFYYRIARGNRQALPLVICLVATMFSSGYGLSGTFVYTGIPLLLLYYYD